MKILTFVNYYLPGFRGGGPVRSIANMVAHLGSEFQFQIVTTDRDKQDQRPYAGVEPGRWQRVGKAEVLYMPDERMTPWGVRELLTASDCDLIYLNSFFHPRYTTQVLLLRYLGLIPEKPVVVAPRGEFSPGALELKKWRKRLYTGLVRVIGLYEGVLWQASSVHEESQIRAIFGGSAIDRLAVLVAPDMTEPNLDLADHTGRAKAPGVLRAAFLSRITRKKNLDGALRLLSGGLRGEVEFNIFGAVDDNAYWEECQKIIQTLPDNIQVRYAGPVGHASVHGKLLENDLFFLPTLGENFGHVVLEALSAGCNILISDQTPWLDLEERGIGWAVPLEQPARFGELLQRMIDMGPEEFKDRSDRACAYAVEVSHNPDVVRENRELFEQALVLQLGSRSVRERTAH